MRKGFVGEILHYFENIPKYIPEIYKAKNSFWGDEKIIIDMLEGEEKIIKEALFNSWFLFDYKLSNGKTPLKTYFLTNFLNFDENDRENYKNLLKSKYGLWRIKKVDFEQGMLLSNLVDGSEFYVKEKKATYNAKVDDVILQRITKIDDHYELISPDGNSYFPDGLRNPAVGILLRYKKLNPKIIKNVFKKQERLAELSNQYLNNDFLQKKIVGPNECICDECHKTGKIGAFLTNEITGEPLVFCLDCTLKINARKNKTTVEQERHKREVLFKASNLFTMTKVKDYCEAKGLAIESAGMDILNKILPSIQEAWNGLSVKERRSFDELNETEMIVKFSNIHINFPK